MITVYLTKNEYEYDIHTLLKAFYPNEPIKVAQFGDKEEISTQSDLTEEPLTIHIILDEDKILMKAFKLGEKLAEVSSNKSLENIKDYKNHLKRELYKLLNKLTNIELPWGILTGIRPTKLALDPLLQGEDITKIKSHLSNEYLCSDKKIDLSIEIAKRELELLQKIDYKNSYSIYIGIPFCPSTCLYCSFTSYSAEKFKDLIEVYLEALMKEISYAKTAFTGKKLSTIYIGGGTPTTLTAEQLDRLLTHVANCFDVKNLMEYTVEAGRPDSITLEKLEVLKRQGVSRISINPQTMMQKTLDVIGRKHTVQEIIDAYYMARKVGHDNINMDIIIGLPGETKEDVAYTLSEIGKLNPDSLTVHTLAIKRAARLNIEKENYKDMAAHDAKEMLELTTAYAKEYDYLPYYLYRQKNMADNLENTGYAHYGKECIYNILIMEEKQTILALGAGSVSKFVFHNENRIERVDNVKSLIDYINRIDEMIERKVTFISNNRSELERTF